MNKHYHLNKFFFQNPLHFDGFDVIQIGRMYCTDTTIIEPHIHPDYFELTVVTGGTGQIYTNGIPTIVKKGDIYLSMPCDTHSIQTDPNDLLKFDFFGFIIQDGCFTDEFERITQDYISPDSRVFRDERIPTLIGSAVSELDEENIYRNELLTAVFRQLLIYVTRAFRNIQPRLFPAHTSRSEVLCYRLMTYIDTHIYTMKTLEELAAATGYSYGYLSAVFKETTGNTLSNYFKEKKMDTAKLLLQEKTLTVTEVADRLCYASVYAFSRAFTTHFGISPKAYQQLH